MGQPSVGGDHLLFVRTLIVIVNFDTTLLSLTRSLSYHHPKQIHGDLSFGTKNGDYISASTGSDKNRVAFKIAQLWSISSSFLKTRRAQMALSRSIDRQFIRKLVHLVGLQKKSQLAVRMAKIVLSKKAAK